MPWRQVLVALLCTGLTVQSSPCSWVEVLSSWNQGHKAVVKLQMEETVDHWDIDVEFSEAVIKFEAWKGHVNKISDTHYMVNNTCYNKMVYSCQCFELPYLVRHEPMWEGNTTFKFNGEVVPACDPPSCDDSSSSGEANITTGGNPDNKEPTRAKFFEVRRYTQESPQKTDILVQEMDIEEHGLYFFTQVTSYDKDKKLLNITIPTHGFNEDKVEGSTTYLLQTGTNGNIFDTEISVIGGKSYKRNVSIDIQPIVDMLQKGEKNENLQNSNIKSNHSQTIVSYSERADTSSLSDIVKELTKGKEVFHIRKIPISDTTKKSISLGAIYVTNMTMNKESEPTKSLFNTRQKRQAQDFSKKCSTPVTAFLNIYDGPDTWKQTCYYTLKYGTETQYVSHHEITTNTGHLECCNDNTTFAFPAHCQCDFLYKHDESHHTNRQFGICLNFTSIFTAEHCCTNITVKGVDYYSAGLTGLGDFGCKDQCLYNDGNNFRCFKTSDNVNTYCDTSSTSTQAPPIH